MQVTAYEYKVSDFQRARHAGRTGEERTHQRVHRSRIVQEEFITRSELMIDTIELLLLTRKKKHHREYQYAARQGVGSLGPARSAVISSALTMHGYIVARQACG